MKNTPPTPASNPARPVAHPATLNSIGRAGWLRELGDGRGGALVQARAPDAKRANEFAPTVKSRDGVVPAARIARAAQATAWFT